MLGGTNWPGGSYDPETHTVYVSSNHQVVGLSLLPVTDKATGREAGAVWMPAPQTGSPMTYMWNGRQYIIVAISGGNVSGEYVAFSLPERAVPRTSDGTSPGQGEQ